MGVGQVGGEGVLHRLQHRPVGGLVEDDVDAGHRRPHRRLVPDVAFDQFGVGRHVVGEAGREIVEHPDLEAFGQEPVGQVRPDEARSAGDERPHGGPPYRGRTGPKPGRGRPGNYLDRLWTSSSGS